MYQLSRATVIHSWFVSYLLYVNSGTLYLYEFCDTTRNVGHDSKLQPVKRLNLGILLEFWKTGMPIIYHYVQVQFVSQ